MKRWIRDIGEGLLWVGLCYLIGWLAYPYLPEKVPSHFNIQWQPDGWMSREKVLWFTPIMLVVLWGVLTLCFWLASTEKGQLKLEETDLKLLQNIRTLMGAFIVAIHAAILAVGLGWLSSPRPVIFPAIGLLFLIIGNVLPKLKRNWVAGVRLPWTVVNERAWREANKFAGYGFMAIGGLFLIAPLFPSRFDLMLVVPVFVLILVILVQSYIVYRRANTSIS
ncbi:MAG: SdpI family protein [Candidatus Fervidibacter sp.]|uniref:SdpI family protein n=1 Tax=Candidatus Fervidibacter sp. TaxID=3100871 RepID=UPI00404AC657